MTRPAKLLVIEDDLALGQLMSDYLEMAGYHVTRATNAAQGMDILARLQPAMVLLDLSLPDEDGLVVLRRMRQLGDLPIAVISGRNDSDNRITSLEMGADDFIAKPFVGRELVARVRNILRRSHGQSQQRNFEVDGLVFRLNDQYVVGRDGNHIALTNAESEVLQALVNAAGRTLSREQLMDAHGSLELAETTRSIDIIISRLRAKLEQDRKLPSLILTVQGRGYRLNL